MKRVILRVSVFVLTFVAALMVASKYLNEDHDNLTMEVGDATLPVITMLWQGEPYNPLHGLTSEVDPASFREQITLLGEGRATDFVIRPYGRIVSKITAQVRSGDGTRLIENIEIADKAQSGDEIQAQLVLKDLIEKNTEYVVTIDLLLDGWQKVSYVTRVIWDEESLFAGELAFVKDFHEKLYHREAAKVLAKYLEPNSKLEDNRSFHKVNIHSSFKQVTWGNLKVTEVRKPSFTLKEIHGQYAAIQVDYGVTTAGSDRNTQYRLREYYRIKQTKDRTYLLEYDRTMTQIPEEDALVGGDKLLLGIGDENVAMLENEDGSVVAFEQADRLFSYRAKDQKLALLFSFYEPGREDAREEYDAADVKILHVDAEGNVYFAVCGYMNRGEREGQMGIRICRYDNGYNTISELAFLPWKQSYESLKANLDKLLYLGQEHLLYIYLEHAVYCVDLEAQESQKLIEVTRDGAMAASEDHQILVWLSQVGSTYENRLHIRDLSGDGEAVISAGSDEAIRLLGFMGQDVIYGVAKISQIIRTDEYPMYKLCIARADGSILKTYAQDGIYVGGVTVEDNQIILDRMTQKDDGSFVEATQDHVTKTQQEKAGKNQISVVEIDTYEKYVQIKVSSKIDPKKLQILTPKEVIKEGADELVIEVESPVRRYFVYASKGLDGDYVTARNAILRADEISGTVLTQEGEILWQKGERSSRNQIMAIREPEGGKEPTADCLDVMLRQKGISVDSDALLSRGMTPLQILSESLTEGEALDLTGITLDAALYFVGKDLPVLALLSNGEAVLITGYNESQVVLYQPSTGKLAKKGMSDATKWFEESGNAFLSYFP